MMWIWSLPNLAKRLERARKGEGPSYIVANTYRFAGTQHVRCNEHRTKEEIEKGRALVIRSRFIRIASGRRGLSAKNRSNSFPKRWLRRSAKRFDRLMRIRIRRWRIDSRIIWLRSIRISRNNNVRPLSKQGFLCPRCNSEKFSVPR